MVGVENTWDINSRTKVAIVFEAIARKRAIFNFFELTFPFRGHHWIFEGGRDLVDESHAFRCGDQSFFLSKDVLAGNQSFQDSRTCRGGPEPVVFHVFGEGVVVDKSAGRPHGRE